MSRVTKVLMCRPTHFDVDYVINPHMVPHSVNQRRAMQQWESLLEAVESLGVTAEVIDQKPDVPDMVFATDQGIVKGDKALLANFRYPERKRETHYYRQWFQDNGYEPQELTHLFSFEGGDALFVGDVLFVGTGFRANVASCEELSQALNADVVPLRLVDPKFYHLDMCFLPLDDETAFYYPPAFSDSSRARLQKLVPDLHELSAKEAESYCANSFVSGRTVVAQSGSPSFKRKLEKLGRNVVEVNMNEFKKAGGGIHCLINTLERK